MLGCYSIIVFIKLQVIKMWAFQNYDTPYSDVFLGPDAMGSRQEVKQYLLNRR